MEVLTFLTTLSMLVYSVLRIIQVFVPEKERLYLQAPAGSQTDHMVEVELKGLDYGPPMRYFIQGQNSRKVWLLAQSTDLKQSSLVVNREAITPLKKDS